MDLDALRMGSGAPRPRGDAPAREPVPVPNANRAEARAAAEQAAASEQAMRRAIEKANRALTEKGRELTFEFNDDVGRVIVRLIDRKTGEVLRQIPSPEMVEIARLLEAKDAAGALLRASA